MYQFTTTERNNAKASEYETKSMLYLFGCRKDSKEMDVFIIDCFNDVSGADKAVQRLWDVQSKGVKSLNPKKIGKALITLFQNFISGSAWITGLLMEKRFIWAIVIMVILAILVGAVFTKLTDAWMEKTVRDKK